MLTTSCPDTREPIECLQMTRAASATDPLLRRLGTSDTLARSLAETLLREGGWYADFSVGNDHVVVFADRVFRYERGDRKERRKIEEYAAAVGVPLQQIDWVD
jgi:hypothetical protein